MGEDSAFGMTNSAKTGRKDKKRNENTLSGSTLRRELDRKCNGLVYISEIDSPVEAFEFSELSSENLKKLHKSLKKQGDMALVELKQRITRIDPSYSDFRNQNSVRFLELFSVLEENLSYLTLYREGRVEVGIYIYGLDRDGALMGVKTKALET